MGKRGPKPGSESAKRISEALKGRYTHEHFQEIGRAGGKRTVEVKGAEHFREAGKRGGKAVLDKYGVEHMHQIASKGGSATRSG